MIGPGKRPVQTSYNGALILEITILKSGETQRVQQESCDG